MSGYSTEAVRGRKQNVSPKLTWEAGIAAIKAVEESLLPNNKAIKEAIMNALHSLKDCTLLEAQQALRQLAAAGENAGEGFDARKAMDIAEGAKIALEAMNRKTYFAQEVCSRAV
jgi:hypothetical protein